MREIKLRAYVEDYPLMNSNGMCDVISIDFKGGLVKLHHKGIMAQFEIDDVKLMQYTGLNDKNGKEIYEGDIVKCGTNKAGVVAYDPYEALYHVGNDPLQYYVYGSAEPETMRVKIEIIGNIYEKPELIKGV